jgi:hypothetical protein
MKKILQNAPLLSILASMTLLGIGCGKQIDQLDSNWTPPVAVSSSIAGLGGAVVPHKFQNTLIGVEVLKDGSGNLYLWNKGKGSWSQSHIPGSPDAGGWTYLWGAAAIDPQTLRILLPQGYCENEQLVMKAFMGTINILDGGLRNTSEIQWFTDKKALLGETGPNVRLNEPGSRYGAGLGPSVLDGSEMYIPFSLHAQNSFGINNVSNGPFANGVFYSSDSGKTWQMEKISDFETWGLAMSKTTGHVYYFGGIYNQQKIWFSRKQSEGGKWEEPQAIIKTFARVDGHFSVESAGDLTHICWMDKRHNKTRFNLTGPPVENNDIYYRRRKDTDREWSKEVLLSEGLLYCYAPTICAEGDNVVVVWAGIQTAGKQHTDMGPNDIYYVTSKNGGKTWTKPLKMTDGAKDGITAGMPQVALLNGTIHLLYIQGAKRTPKELSPGLTRLGQEPWPIYHQQRPFPD